MGILRIVVRVTFSIKLQFILTKYTEIKQSYAEIHTLYLIFLKSQKTRIC